jgi:hypothetical protein
MHNPIFRRDILVAPGINFLKLFEQYGAQTKGTDNTLLTPRRTLNEAWDAIQQWQLVTQGKPPQPLPEDLQPFQHLIIPAGMARLTNNMVFLLLMTPQLLTDPNHPAMQPLHAKASLNIVLAEINQRFQKYLPPEYQARGWKLEIYFSTFFLDVDGQQNPGTTPPITDYLRVLVIDGDGNCVSEVFGAIASYPWRDLDFYTLQTKIDPLNLGNFGRINAQLHALVQDTLTDYPLVMIACPENSTLFATGKTDPVLGKEYTQSRFFPNITDEYFGLMGLKIALYAPADAAAPFRLIHHQNIDLRSQNPIKKAAIVAVMGPFQEMLWPGIYCSQKPLEAIYKVDRTAPHTPPLLGGYGYILALRNLLLGPYQAMWTAKYFEAHQDAIKQLLETQWYLRTARELMANGYRR